MTTPLIPDEVAHLEPFVEAGVFGATELQFAAAMARTIRGVDAAVLLAGALCVRALGWGDVCVDLSGIVELVEGDLHSEQSPTTAALAWPALGDWKDDLCASDAVRYAPLGADDLEIGDDEGVTTRPLVFDGARLYLTRYWVQETRIAGFLTRAGTTAERSDDDTALENDLQAALDRYFGTASERKDGGPDLQREAVARAVQNRVTVIAGGPGTGKTYTIARLLAVYHDLAAEPSQARRVALAAPTGKAAKRMGEALAEATESLLGSTGEGAPVLEEWLRGLEPSTIHRLLGWFPDGTFRHDPANPLPHDLVVIDETSMIDLPMMARLVGALRPDAKLVLVGDPDQLASVEAGTVLGDIVDGDASRDAADTAGYGLVVTLTRPRRFGAKIADLAAAVRDGDAKETRALLSAGDGIIELVDPTNPDALAELVERVVATATLAVEGARSWVADDPAALFSLYTDTKVLCATRNGDRSVAWWTREIERGLGERIKNSHTRRRDTWYEGRPVIVTRNDYANRVFNGDTGVVVERDGRPMVLIDAQSEIRELSPALLDEPETWWAMTIHRSQGSEFDHVIVSLPETANSPILTKKLLYTAITRAKSSDNDGASGKPPRLTVLATDDVLTRTVAAQTHRSSGLAQRISRAHDPAPGGQGC